MRLNWFLPFRRKSAGSRVPLWLRRSLKRLGPSVVASPLRRLAQVVCLLVFLILFYVVCWPYSASPLPPGQASSGWQLQELDQQTGQLQFRHPAPPAWLRDAKQDICVTAESSLLPPEQQLVARLEIVTCSEDTLTCRLPAQLAAEQLDWLLTGSGPWKFHQRSPHDWPAHYADDLARKEVISAELFLAIDPLVSLSTAVASRSWVWSLIAAGGILLVCLLIPRGFCGYVCPLGTVIDLFDWSIGRRVTRFRVASDGWWVHTKYYLLTAVMFCSVLGVLVSGFFAAIPVITRALLFLTEPLQTGTLRGWHLVPSIHGGHVLSIVLFLCVLGLGLLRPRFWCRYVCPSGALFSLGNLLRVTERKVETSCIHCNKCIEICPFDAIKPDFTTRTSDCTFCQSCGGVCPTYAIKFVQRWDQADLKAANDPPTGDTAIGRRGFLSWAAGTSLAAAGGLAAAAVCRSSFSAHQQDGTPLVRPPGSVPEEEFLQMCIRCGECFKVCPNNVLQAEGFQQGLAGLWAPLVVADWAGCESSCNACGHVCPTGAIRALPLDEKRIARMGLAVVDLQTCLPYADREACQLCVDECNAAGYRAIEFLRVHTQVDAQGLPLEDSGFLAPAVDPQRCVGCGLCQTRCYGINVKTTGLLTESAIVVQAGRDKEDRLMTGSYRELRAAEAKQRQQQPTDGSSSRFLPNTEPEKKDEQPESSNPF